MSECIDGYCIIDGSVPLDIGADMFSERKNQILNSLCHQADCADVSYQIDFHRSDIKVVFDISESSQRSITVILCSAMNEREVIQLYQLLQKRVDEIEKKNFVEYLENTDWDMMPLSYLKNISYRIKEIKSNTSENKE